MVQDGMLTVADPQYTITWSVLPTLPEDELLDLNLRQHK